VSEDRAREQWPWASRNPVTKEAYEAVLNGHPWPDVDARVHEANGSLGHNQPPLEDEKPEDVLRAKILAAIQGLPTYVSWRDDNPATLASSLQTGKIVSRIEDDEALARAQSLRSMLLGHAVDASRQHKEEKEPHLLAGRAVDAKWFSLRDLAQTAADALRKAMGAWETQKLQRQLAEQQAAQKAAEAAQEAARAAGTPLPPQLAPSPPPPPAAPRKIKGGSGRAASVATITQVQSVTDWAALAAYYCLQDDVQQAVLKHANATLKSDPAAKVPGVVTQQVRDVK